MSEQPLDYGSSRIALGLQDYVSHTVASHPHLTGGLASAGLAAGFQEETAGLAAQSRITGQSIAVLRHEVQSLAQAYPVGTAGARAYVQVVQQLGNVSAGSERQVGALARVLVQSQAAVGGLGPAYTLSFGQLQRMLGSMDPARVSRFADSVTELSAKTGAGADGLIAMSRAIAPMAREAGLGQTAVLGISASFAKLGDDSGAAATAVNRILSDISRAAKTGSNDLGAYASVVGMTLNQFRELVRLNPQQALTRVVGALGSSPQGLHVLEARGLDGVRSARALSQLAQSGDLAGMMGLANRAYGSGATAKAAATAFDTANASLERLTATAHEIGTAVGAPAARVITQATRVTQGPLGFVANALNSPIGQTVLNVGATAGLAGLLGIRALARGYTAALGVQAVRSGPVAAAFGGYRTGTGQGVYDQDRRFRGWMARAYNPMIEAAAEGRPLGRGPMERVNRGVFGFFRDFGAQLDADRQIATDAWYRRLARRGWAVSMHGAATLTNIWRQPFEQAFQDPTRRDYQLTREGGMMRRFGAGVSEAFTNRDADALRKAVRGLGKDLGDTSLAARGLARAATLGARDVTAFTLRGGAGVLGGIARGLVGMVANPVTIGLGALAVGSRLRSDAKATREEFDRPLEMFSTVNRYRDALGMAAEATTDFAGKVAAAANAFGQSHQPTNIDAARHVTPEQLAAAGPSPHGKRTFHGTDRQIARQIEAAYVGTEGISAAELQQVGTDLLKGGYSQSRVESILGQVNVTPTAVNASMIDTAVTAAAKSSANYSPSTWESIKRTGGLGPTLSGLLGTHPESQIGTGGAAPLIGDSGEQVIRGLITAMQQQWTADQEKGGLDWATQRLWRNANALMKRVIATGDPDLEVFTAKELSKMLSGKAIRVRPGDVEGSKGDIVGLTASHGHTFGGQKYGQWQSRGVSATGPEVAPQVVETGGATGLRATLDGVAPALGNALTGRSGDVVADRLGPQSLVSEDPQLQRQAAAAAALVLSGGGKDILGALGTATRGQAALTPEMVGFNQIGNVRALLSEQLSAQLPGMRPGAATTAQLQAAIAQATATGPSAAPEEGRSAIHSLLESTTERLRARLEAQRNYEIASDRSWHDYYVSRRDAEDDFQRSQARATRDHTIALKRMVEDAAKSLYNVYDRIQVHPVWDAQNLTGNLEEQNRALSTQAANLATLRRAGLSNMAIQQMALADTNNAGQAAQLVADLMNDPKLIGQINALIQQRLASSKTLVTDPSNENFRRSEQDWQRSMTDAAVEQGIALDRMARNQSTAMSRMKEDLHNADLQLVGDYESLHSKMMQVLAGQQVDWSGSMVNGLTDTLQAINTIKPQIDAALGLTGQTGPPKPGDPNFVGPVSVPPTDTDPTRPTRGGNPAASSQSTGSSTTPTQNRAAGKAAAAAYGWTGAQWTALDSLWTKESGWSSTAANPDSGAYGIPQGVPSVHPDYASVMRSGATAQIAWGLGYIRRRYGSPVAALDWWKTGSQTYNATHPEAKDWGHWYGDGGVFTEPQRIGVGERGPEAVIPLDARGMKAMTGALRAYVGLDEARTILSGGRATAITVHSEHHHHDNRVDMTGAKIEVRADDPHEFGRKVETRVRAANSSRGRG